MTQTLQSKLYPEPVMSSHVLSQVMEVYSARGTLWCVAGLTAYQGTVWGRMGMPIAS